MRRRHQRRKRSQDLEEVSMTPMIDVVFQLLIYFLVTFEVQESISHLGFSRPSAEVSAKEHEYPPKMIRIDVSPLGFAIHDKSISETELEHVLRRLSAVDNQQTILIRVDSKAPHNMLISVLDLCGACGFTNLSVVSERS